VRGREIGNVSAGSRRGRRLYSPSGGLRERENPEGKNATKAIREKRRGGKKTVLTAEAWSVFAGLVVLLAGCHGSP